MLTEEEVKNTIILDGITTTEVRVLILTNSKNERIGIVHLDAKLIKLDDEFRQFHKAFPFISKLVAEGFRVNSL